MTVTVTTGHVQHFVQVGPGASGRYGLRFPFGMLSSDDPFLANFERTFGANANYDPGTFQKAGADPAPIHSPVSFYDRHIASNLLLKNVVFLPSFTRILSKAFQEAVRSFLNAGHGFPTSGYGGFPLKCPSKTFTDANSVLEHYDIYMSNLASGYASKLVLHPDSPNWDSIFRPAIKSGEADLNFTAETWLIIDCLLSDKIVLYENLSPSTRKRIEDLEVRFSRLATWDMFAMTETAANMFQSLTGSTPFNWETCRTLGCNSISHLPLPPDAKPGLLDTHLAAKFRSVSRSGHGISTKTAKIIVVPRLPSRRRQYRPDLRHYIQHAWATAAANDTTFFVLHCGRYERIGFRHRASQTLYLSGIIDTINTRNPSYRELTAGLYLAILQDALRRAELLDLQVGSEKPAGSKRSAEHLDHDLPSARRRKKDTAVPDDTVVDIAKVSDELARRKLAVVRLEYGAYCSPIPSSFVRIGPTCLPGYAPLRVTKAEKEHPKQSRFKAHERFSLTLKEPLGDGAVGVVHPAVVELTLESGETLRHNLAMKLAFSAEQQKKLKNEYLIYGHLSRKDGVLGIPTVHGVFRDPELDILGMLMSDAGRSLRDREIEKGKEGRKVSEEERKGFVEALKSLHKAGVRHHDIRPENLLINSEGQVSIIDLDRADFNVNEQLLKDELSILNQVLNGWY